MRMTFATFSLSEFSNAEETVKKICITLSIAPQVGILEWDLVIPQHFVLGILKDWMSE
jgi:hypothetical protein